MNKIDNTDNFGIEMDFSIESAPDKELAEIESYERATADEISDTLRAFRDQAEKEKALKDQNVGTDFWFAVCFASQSERDEFLNKFGLLHDLYDQYISAKQFCKALGYDLPQTEIQIPKNFKSPANIGDMILDI